MTSFPSVLVWRAVNSQWASADDSWLRYTGQSSEQALGHGWLAAVHPDDRASLVEVFESAVAQTEHFRFECRLKRSDGVYCWFLLVGIPQFDPEGEFTGFIGSCADIHDYRVAHESARYFVEGLANAPMVLARVDKDLRYTWIHNPRPSFAPETFLGKRDDEVLPPDCVSEIIALRQQVLDTAIGQRREIAYQMSGLTKAYDVMADPIFDESGSVIGVRTSAFEITARRQLEESLRASEERFRLATEALHGLIYDWDRTTNAITRSGGLVDVLGFTPDEVPAVGSWWSERIHPDDQAYQRARFDEAVAKREPDGTIEYRVRHKDDHYVWVWDHFRVLYDEQGEPVRLVGCTLSIDRAKQVESALRASEERFRMATDALQGVIYDYDHQTSLVQRSQGLFHLLGYRQHEVEPTLAWWYERIHPDDLARNHAMLAEASSRREPIVETEYRIRHRDGHYVWVLDQCRVVYGEDGQPVRAVGSTLSIDALKRTNEALRASDERFRLATEALQGLIYDFDLETGEVQRSQGLYEVLGYSPNEVPTTTEWWNAQVHPDDLALSEREFEMAVRTQTPIVKVEYRVRHRDGYYVWVMNSCCIVYDEHGKPRRVVGCNISIDALKRANEALASSEERFRLATEALQGLVYDWNLETGEIQRSQGLYGIIGYHVDEIPEPAEWWLEQLHPDDLVLAQQVTEMSIRERSPLNKTEYRILHRSGDYIWVSDYSRIVYNEQGRPRRFIGCTVSINEVKLANQKLYESEERLRRLMAAAPVFLFQTDAAGNLLFSSKSFIDYTQKTSDDLKGWGWAEQDIVHPDDLPDMIERWSSSLKTGEQFEMELRLGDGNGVYRWHINRVVPTCDETGRITGWVGASSNIDERKKAEARTHVLQQLTASLSQAATPQAVAEIILQQGIPSLGATAGSVCLLVENGTMLEIAGTFGYADGLVQVWQRFPVDSPYAPIALAVRTRESQWFATHTELRTHVPQAPFSPGDLDHHAWGALPLLIKGEVIGALGMSFPTERVFDQDQRDFAETLAHYCAQALERAYLAEQARDNAALKERQRLARDLHDAVSQSLFTSTIYAESAVRMWERNPQRAVSLLGQVLQLNRSALAEMRTLLWELRPEAILNTTLSELLKHLVEASKGRKSIEASLHVQGADVILPPDAQVAMYRISQEAIHNILKHSQATEFTVRLEQSLRQIRLCIADNGRGFDTRKVSGGLGMGSMRERAQGIGALIEVSSTEGEGTTIDIVWEMIVQATA